MIISQAILFNRIMAKIFGCLLVLSTSYSTAWSQGDLKHGSSAPIFHDAHEFSLLGRGATIPASGYNRIDTTYLTQLPKSVARLSKNTAGLQINFKTNSQSISFKWVLAKYGVLPNLTPIAKNGLDLYGWNGHQWQFVGSAAASGDSSQVTAIKNLDGKMRAYKAYLPLYSSLTSLNIGIDSGASITPIQSDDKGLIPKRKIVIYGSSITQGASASRPGMAYPSILGRWLDAEVFNLGFSGSGKMERIMADVIGKMPADLYVLDCVPNPSPEQIKTRAVPFIKALRKLQPKVPILIVASVFRESANWNLKLHATVTAQNAAIFAAYNQLKKEGMNALYYLPADQLTGDDHEASIDGTHLTDLGFMRLAKAIEAKILEIIPDWRAQKHP